MATRSSFPMSVRFDCFQVDLSSNELLRSGVRIPIQEKPFQILRLLLEAEGEVVTREQIRLTLWPQDTFVDFEHGVNTAVKKLRQALEDSADHPNFVETLPKIGYRFMVAVEWVPNGNKSSPGNVVSIAPGPVAVSPLAPLRRWKLKLASSLAAVAVLAAALLFVGKRYLARAPSHPQPQGSLRQRRLTANPESTPLTAGILSPDGKYLAYSDPTGFYLRLVDSGETHAVPMPQGFDPLPESWFPDSVHMIVTSFGDKRIPFAAGTPRARPPSLWEISVLGGTPRKLTDRGSSARVSPDGSQIAFLAGRWDDEEIWLMQADGGNARKIVDGGRDDFSAVAWAPDSKAFASVRVIVDPRTHQPLKRIELYDPATGRNEVILSDLRLGDHLAWMKDGRLLYSLGEPEPNWSDQNLWSVRLEAGGKRPLGPPARITNDRGSIGGVSVAEAGRRIALLRYSAQSDVYITEISGPGKHLSPPRRLTMDERDDWPNAWTADNRSVLFRSNREGFMQIYRQDITESQPEVLVSGKDKNIIGGPRLSADGLSALYLVKPDLSDSLRLMRARIAGGPSQLILELPGLTNFQCAAPPSTVCIYGQLEPQSPFQRFFTFDPAGTKGQEILIGKMKNEDGPNFWTLSPDGKRIVTSRSQDPNDDPVLRIFEVATGAAQDLPVPDIGLIYGMDWAANSKSVWLGGFMGRGAWGTRSGILNVELGGKVRTAYKGSNPEFWYSIPSPDGRRLALMGRAKTSNMWLLENF